jgi:hypothetical protein
VQTSTTAVLSSENARMTARVVSAITKSRESASTPAFVSWVSIRAARHRVGVVDRTAVLVYVTSGVIRTPAAERPSASRRFWRASAR